MPNLMAGDLLGGLAAAAVLAEVDCWTDLQAVAMPCLAAMVGADLIIYHELDLASARQLDLAWPTGALTQNNMGGYAAVMPDHPFIAGLPILQLQGTMRLVELPTPVRWRDSRVYAESLRGLGADDQMACLIASAGAVRLAFTCSRRGGQFSVRDRAVLSHLRPHLAAAVRRLRRYGGSYTALQTVPTPRFVVVREDTLHPLARDRFAAGGTGTLTAREAEVIALLSTGHTSAQMARLLGCSARTVDKHVEHIRSKLGVTSRLQAVTEWRSAAPTCPLR